MSAKGLETIRRRHTCAHRVNELLQIVAESAQYAAEQTSTAGGGH
jgi:spore maturation protein CgeB